MKPYIKIIRRPYEEPHLLNLVIEASNGSLNGKLEYYINADDLINLAKELEIFPRHSTSVHLWELGSEKLEDRYAYYFRFRVFTTNPMGKCAIQLRFNNNKELPEREVSEFCIPVDSSDLNRLGRLIRAFSKLEHKVLYWDLKEDKLFEIEREAEQI